MSRYDKNRELSGMNPLAYMGVNPTTPPQLFQETRLPTVNDYIGYNQGDFWLHIAPVGDPTNGTVYMLASKINNQANWVEVISAPGDIIKLRANDGLFAFPITGGVNIVGDGLTTTTTASVPNTITISLIDQPSDTFQTNSGAATPDIGTGVIDILGGKNISTRASAADTVTIDLSDNVNLLGELTAGTGITATTGGLTVTAGATTLTPLASTAATGFITVNNTGVLSELDTGAAGSVLIGGATPSFLTPGIDGYVLTTHGAGNVPTWTAAGSSGGAANSFVTNTAGPAIPTGLGSLSVLGSNIVTTDGSVANTVTIGLTKGANGAVALAQGVSSNPVWGTLVAGSGINISAGVGNITITNTGGGGGVAGILQMTASVGGSSSEDGSNNLNLYGTTNQIVTTATPAHSITISLPNTLTIPGTLTMPALSSAGVVQTNGSGTFTSTTGTNGQVLIAGGTGPTWAPITAGSGISITNGVNSITVTNTSTVEGSSTFNTNNGTANTVAGVIYINGGTNTNTSGSNSGGQGTVKINLSKAIVLPQTITTGSSPDVNQGIIAIGTNSTPSLPADRFIHSWGTQNCFVGHAAGNFTMSSTNANSNVGVGSNVLDALVGSAPSLGAYNTGTGYGVLTDCTDGSYNSGYGAFALNNVTSAQFNSAFGRGSCQTLTTGSDNAAFGGNTLENATTATLNTVIGHFSGRSITIGSGNTAVGANTLYSATTADNNVCIGYNSGTSITTSPYNTLVGYLSGDSITTGNGLNAALGFNTLASLISGGGNIAIGDRAGTSYVGAEGDNICIGSTGTAGETGIIHLGSSGVHSGCYIAGIRGVSPVSGSDYVVIDANGKLAATQSAFGNPTANGQVPIGAATGAVTWANIAAGTGIAITNTAGGISIATSAPPSATIPFQYYLATAVSPFTTVPATYFLGGGIAMTKIFDRNATNQFSGNIFTAPKTGIYFFSIAFNLSQIGTTAYTSCSLFTANITVTDSTVPTNSNVYEVLNVPSPGFGGIVPGDPANLGLTIPFNTYAQMSAGATASFSLIVNIDGAASPGLVLGPVPGMPNTTYATFISGHYVSA